ncbi:LysR family transcriptional regulator [Sinorhizobium numidicum]|uniref:LysR family transcriptional regulator n=1 Tax=Sinorhizobium numidicum TaxID=680248 RepID=A0ABY8CR18_9HYPH|nr:LysR family transcriptional regulator [Sinorhizobium numidicum]WEX75101.1 LysR family transcriptional regulator [Sinorhizobium numidicum]WEX81095.1 LysR family transcriptional regulator [Sinorhizobium numidicum]
MELRQLSYFVAVAEELHFGRAAARLHIAQPALSNQVQALEKELGVQLLTRTTRRVALTRAGEVFHDRCIRILRDVDLSTEATRSVAGKNVKKIKIGTIYPATIGVLPSFLARIARKYPEIQLHISSGSTNDIIRSIETGQINLGFIRPVENIGALRFFSIAQERYLLAVEKQSALAAQSEIGIDDLRDQKIISFSRANLSYTERYFAEKFEEHDLTKNIAYSCDDTFSLVSLVSAGLGIGFAPEWTQDLPNRNFELRRVRGVDFRVGLGVAWNKEDPTAARDDIIDIARSLVRPGR